MRKMTVMITQVNNNFLFHESNSKKQSFQNIHSYHSIQIQIWSQFLTVICVHTICAHFHWQFKMIKLFSSALPTPVPWMGQNEINFGQMKINRLTSSTTNLKSKYWIEPSTKKQEKYRFLDMFVERKSGPSHKTIIKFVPMRFISVIRGHQERVDLTIEDVRTDILWLL